jgi:WD repeat and SOF domain-containing protein 1
MRKLDHAICVHKDHVSAVLAVDYSPTGRQFVSGSYDRTVRIWNASELHSETVYHTKRMQRLFCVGWSMDASYLFSGSDDTNVRIWRAKANERATQPLGREKAKREYEEALVEKFKYVPEVKRIKKHTHVPRAILKAAALKDTVRGTQLKREKNRRAHAAPGKVPKVKDKQKKVWNVAE